MNWETVVLIGKVLGALIAIIGFPMGVIKVLREIKKYIDERKVKKYDDIKSILTITLDEREGQNNESRAQAIKEIMEPMSKEISLMKEEVMNIKDTIGVHSQAHLENTTYKLLKVYNTISEEGIEGHLEDYHNFITLYKIYHDLGGNGKMTKKKEELEELYSKTIK